MLPGMQEAIGEPVPKLECKILMDEIKVVFSTRHYELLSFFFSTITRMKNGRPDKPIRSIKETEPGSGFRKLMTTMLENESPSDPLSPKSAPKPSVSNAAGDEDGDVKTPSDGKKKTISGRLSSLWSTAKEEEETEAEGDV